MWVADYTNDRVTELSEKGEYVREFGSQGRGNGQLESPYAIAVDADGNVWVGDTYNERIDEFNEKGEYLTRFGQNVVSGEVGSGSYEPDQFGLYPGYGLAVDAKGDVWLSDPTNNRIEKWQIPGYATYSSEFGSKGSGDSEFWHPVGVAVDGHGNVWVVDQENDRVEEFNEKEEFEKAFGSQGSGNGQLRIPLGVAVDGKGNIWVADSGNSRVEEFNEKGEVVQAFGSKGTGDGQFAEWGPAGIAVDSRGNVWVSDAHGSRLEEFTEKGVFVAALGFGVTNGKAEYEICTSSCKAGIAGSGPGQFEEPMGVAVGPGGNVWVADYTNNRVSELSEKGEYVREFGSQGRGNGQLESPYAIAIDSNGNVWVGDTYNERIDEFNEEGEYLNRFGQNVVSGEVGPGFYEPDQFGLYPAYGLAVDAKGDIWLSDPTNNRIEKWLVPGYPPPPTVTFQSEFGSKGSGDGEFWHPAGVALDGHGDVWVVDQENDRVEEFNEKEEFVKAFGWGISNGEAKLQVCTSGCKAGIPGSEHGEFYIPSGIAVSASGDVWVVDSGNYRVEEFSEKGEFVQAFGSKGSGNGQFAEWGPTGIAVDSHGNVWVSDAHGGRLEVFNEEGKWEKTVGSKGSGAGELGEPAGVAIGPGGNVWVADYTNDRVTEFNEDGEYIGELGSQGRGNGQLESPYAIAVDANGNVWVGDTYNERIDEFNEEGEYLNRFGKNVVSGEVGPGFYEPDQFGLYPAYGLAVDSKGDIWLSDPTNNRIEKWLY